MKRFIFLFSVMLVTLLSCGNDSDNTSGNDTGSSTTDTDFLVSSYVRGDFYNRGAVSVESINACTDVICVGITPDADGSLVYQNFTLYEGVGAATYQELVEQIRSKLSGSTTVRLGISGGDYWKMMVADENARKNFAKNVSEALLNLQLDGVDLDFEWAETEQEYSEYSVAIVSLAQVLDSDYIFSISLDPFSYKITKAAIDAVDYISLQCYGPLPARFGYDDYVTSITKVVDYGVPSNKLVPGLPFYGVTTDGSKQTVAYANLVNEGLITSPILNEVTYNNQSYTFDGQEMIKQKTQYAISQQFYGMMSWSLGTDVAYSNSLSLLKAVQSCLTNKN